jgi:hypothetical protein
VDRIGQWLPPGAGVNLLRSTAYFQGNGAAGPLNVLIIWTVLGLAAIFTGHHTPFRLAASPAARDRPETGTATPAVTGAGQVMSIPGLRDPGSY